MEGKGEKWPIPPLATTAYTAKTAKKKKLDESTVKARKKESDKARGATRVNIGIAFERWRVLKENKGFKFDYELATFLLDR